MVLEQQAVKNAARNSNTPTRAILSNLSSVTQNESIALHCNSLKMKIYSTMPGASSLEMETGFPSRLMSYLTWMKNSRSYQVVRVFNIHYFFQES